MNGSCLNPLCSCSLEFEDTTHYLLHCKHFSNHCYDLMDSVKSVIPNFESLTNNNRKDIPLHGDHRFDENKNKFFWKQQQITYKILKDFLGHFSYKIFIMW